MTGGGAPAALRLGRFSYPAGGRTLVMGIVNNTPDSFYDRGRHFGAEAAIAHGEALTADGADILDVGGQTGQVGAEIAVAEEIERIAPVVAGLSEHCVSVDCYRAPVAEAALAAGASFINDYTGGHDPDLVHAVAAHGAGLVVSHYQGSPRSNPSRSYESTVDEVLRFLTERAQVALDAGIGADSILVDPCLGFGKSTRLDLALVRDLDRICALGFPVLLACSHKEFTADATGTDEDDLRGTAATVALAARAGVRVLRLHDVAWMRPLIALGDAVRTVAGA